jgi:Phage tail assembly chaperone protein
MSDPAFNFRVFYDPATGDIFGYEHSNTPTTYAGQDYIDFAQPVEWDPRKYKVDLETGTIVEIDPAEMAERTAKQFDADLARDTEQMIRRELDATLETQFADYPASDEQRAQWLDYRRALRKLSELKSDPVAMVRAFPVRPDQQDPIAYLRASVK